LFACSDTDDDIYAYRFFKNKQLNIISSDEMHIKFGEVKEGNNLVFEYEFSTEGEINVIDDEYTEFIHFEIDKNVEEFNFKDEELSTINLVLSKRCFCFFGNDENKKAEPTGIINGKKISENEWNITMEIIFYGDEKRFIQGIFRLKD